MFSWFIQLHTYYVFVIFHLVNLLLFKVGLFKKERLKDILQVMGGGRNGTERHGQNLAIIYIDSLILISIEIVLLCWSHLILKGSF